MKRCPQCNRVEADDALTFCRADGTPLVRDSDAVSDDAGTPKFGSAPVAGETKTRILPQTGAATDEAPSRATAPTMVLDSQQAGGSTGVLGRPISRRGLKTVLVAAAILALAASVYFYLSRKSGAAIDSVAVLPFENSGGDPNLDYLSDGLSESLINKLAQLPQLRVIARSSSFKYRGGGMDLQEVAAKLGVRAVVTGKVVRRGDDLTVRVEAVDARENKQLWGEQYNRKLADLFAVQEEIAKEIAEKLRLKLTGAEQKQLAKRPTENLRAFQYYMQGRASAQRRTREDLLTAVSYYERAIEEDRNYALAYAGLADAFANLGAYGFVVPAEGQPKAEVAARQALSLDEDLAEAHASLGLIYVAFAPSDFQQGDGELRRAIELSPSLAMAHQYLGVSFVRRGRLDEASAEFLKARELDPLSTVIARVVALPYYLKRDYGRALDVLRQADEVGPAFTQTWEIGAYIQSRPLDETLAELEKAKQVRKNDSILIYGTGMVYAAQGRRSEALQIIKELEGMSGGRRSQAHWIAKIYATLNEKELALTWLEGGLEAGAIGFFYKDEPVWDPLRHDPRFADLLRRMGIP